MRIMMIVVALMMTGCWFGCTLPADKCSGAAMGCARVCNYMIDCMCESISWDCYIWRKCTASPDGSNHCAGNARPKVTE